MPSILTLDNEKANILVGQNVPFVTGSYTTASNSSTTPFQTVSRQDVGINLNVIPHIGDNGSVRLEISQEVSSIVDGTLNNVSGVVTNKNLIKTTILADNQQTVALGGLMRDNSTYGQQKSQDWVMRRFLVIYFAQKQKLGQNQSDCIFTADHFA